MVREGSRHQSDILFLWHLPVRMDWSTRRVVDLMEMILMSAGTLSPTSDHTEKTQINLRITVKLHLSVCSVTAGWMQGRGVCWWVYRVDWLVLALWMESVVVENWYHSQRQRERETLGRSWNEKNRCTANRGESPAVHIKCIYTQACCFFSSCSELLQFPSTPVFLWLP